MKITIRHTGTFGLGAILAALLSATLNKSVAWAIVHGLMGWVYLLYAVFFRAAEVNRLFF